MKQLITSLLTWIKELAIKCDQNPKAHLFIFIFAWFLAPLIDLPLLILMLAGFYSFKAIGIVKPQKWNKEIFTGLLLGVGMYMVRSFLLYPMASRLSRGWSTETSEFSPTDYLEGNTELYILRVILAIFHAGIMEEFFYRGYLLNKSVEYLKGFRYRWAMAILAVSMLFGLLHFYMGLTSIIFSFSWFIITSVIYLILKRSIWPMMISHAFADICTWTLAYLGALPSFHNSVMNFWGG